VLAMDSLPGVEFTQLDFLAADASDKLKAMLGGPADVVLSDMAANATGHAKTDHLKIMALVEAAAEFAREVLAPGGTFLAKVLQGGTEAALLAQHSMDRPKWDRVAKGWLASGPALVVVTRGGEGVYAVSANLELHRPALAIDLVDTVGAGDSFTSGLLDGLHRADLVGGARRDALAAIDEATLASVVDAAALIAAITCSRPGPDPPTRDEVDAALAAGSRA